MIYRFGDALRICLAVSAFIFLVIRLSRGDAGTMVQVQPGGYAVDKGAFHWSDELFPGPPAITLRRIPTIDIVKKYGNFIAQTSGLHGFDQTMWFEDDSGIIRNVLLAPAKVLFIQRRGTVSIPKGLP